MRRMIACVGDRVKKQCVDCSQVSSSPRLPALILTAGRPAVASHPCLIDLRHSVCCAADRFLPQMRFLDKILQGLYFYPRSDYQEQQSTSDWDLCASAHCVKVSGRSSLSPERIAISDFSGYPNSETRVPRWNDRSLSLIIQPGIAPCRWNIVQTWITWRLMYHELIYKVSSCNAFAIATFSSFKLLWNTIKHMHNNSVRCNIMLIVNYI